MKNFLVLTIWLSSTISAQPSIFLAHTKKPNFIEVVGGQDELNKHLSKAIEDFDASLVETLLNEGADPNKKDHNTGKPPLHHLVYHWTQGQTRVKKKRSPQKTKKQALRIAAALFVHGADATEKCDGSTAAEAAIWKELITIQEVHKKYNSKTCTIL